MYDIVAGYFSYFLALVMRFYANGEFLIDANIFLETFYKIAPYSAVIIVLIFALFGLYGKRWRYAGFYIKEHGKTCPTEILEAIAGINAEGRPIWKPMHMQPMCCCETA